MGMKKRKVGIIIATLAIVGLGSLFFSQSSNWVMASVQEKLSSQKEIVVTDEVDDKSEQARKEEEQMMLEQELRHQVQLNENLRLDKVGTSYFLYDGQLVYVEDSLVEKDTAEENGMKVMDFIFEELGKEILVQYKLDSIKYTYSIQRNYEKPNDFRYSVSVLQNNSIVCNLEISLDDQPQMVSFAGDRSVEIYGQNRIVTDENIVGNGYNRQKNQEGLYQEYYNYSKNLIENVFQLSSINEKSRDIDNEIYCSVDETRNIVTFGYQLEDGNYVKISYDMINKTLEKFEIEEY